MGKLIDGLYKLKGPDVAERYEFERMITPFANPYGHP
jgi:hypothetical protein